MKTPCFTRSGWLQGLFQILGREEDPSIYDELFADTPIPSRIIDEPRTLILSRDMIGLYHQASCLRGERSIGLRAGAASRFSTVGRFGAYVCQAPTLVEAFHRIRDCIGNYSSCGSIRVQTKGDELIVENRNVYQQLTGFRQTGDVALSMMWGLAQEYLGLDVAPTRIESCYNRGSWIEDHETHFGAPAVPGQARLAIVLPRDVASTPRRQSLAAGSVLTQADVLLEVAPPPSDFVDAVSRVIDLHLSKQDACIESAAKTLSVSPRTLQRRLRERSTTFRGLLLSRRSKRAQALLRETTLPIHKISAELGYADPPQFVRALKGTTGLTPAAFRRAFRS
ncbi:MAG: helix-turn-helix domain-containing protein [Myxococcota bacterium]